MKKLLASALVLLALTGCAGPADYDHEALYLKLVHDNTTNKSTDAALIKMAHAACDALASGGSLRDLSMVVATSDLSANQRNEVSKVLGYAISQYCPQP